MTLKKIGDRHGIALTEPILFLIGQCALEEITWASKAQDGQAALTRTTARGSEVVELELSTQYGVDGLGQGGALARAEAAVVAKVARDHGVCRMFKLEGESDQFGASLEQGFGVHVENLSGYDGRSRRAIARG